jgi:hypothetical protein
MQTFSIYRGLGIEAMVLLENVFGSWISLYEETPILARQDVKDL